MKLVLLAAGFATRLYPLTRDRAKPLLEVGGKPIAEHILDSVLELGGFSEGVVVTNARFRAEFEGWLGSYRPDIPLRLVANEVMESDQRLGAVRDLALAVGSLGDDQGEDLLVIAGDNLCELDLRPHVAKLAETRRPVLVRRDVPGGPAPKRYGEIELGEHDRVSRFREKPADPRSELVSTGIYLFPPELAEWLASYLAEGRDGDSPGMFIEWLSARTEIYALPFEGRWFDVGTPETLAAARAEY